jgi:hypothetical protein
MLSEALQRNAKHEARPFKHLWLFLTRDSPRKGSEIESLASQTLSAALQLRFAQNDIWQLSIWSC